MSPQDIFESGANFIGFIVNAAFVATLVGVVYATFRIFTSDK